jgi:predicted anti-sigma-YlaC factor YlaD
MTCREYEPLLALYVEGDLDDPDVERHLAECEGCRELLDDLRASQAMLRKLGTADPAFLAAVRTEVLAKIREKRRTVWPWIAAYAAALALFLAVFAEPRGRSLVPIARTVQPLVSRVAEDAHPVSVRTSAPVHKGRRGRRPQTKGSAPPLVVKMLTDDPNIVIIWLVDQPGD